MEPIRLAIPASLQPGHASGLCRLAAGEGRAIAGAGSKDVFRGSEEAA